MANSTVPARPNMPAKVLMVDDHPAVRRGMADAIEGCEDLTVSAAVGTAREAKDALRRERPDVIVLDLTLGDESGLELIKDLAAQEPALPVLVLSMHDETLYAERALRAGAQGYIMKDEPLEKVLEAIRQVLGGRLHLSPTMSGRLLERIVSSDVAADDSFIDRLTDRELEVFELIGHGVKTREIARRLHLSVKTIYTHCENIKRKLKLADATELHQQAFEWVRQQEGGGEPPMPKVP